MVQEVVGEQVAQVQVRQEREELFVGHRGVAAVEKGVRPAHEHAQQAKGEQEKGQGQELLAGLGRGQPAGQPIGHEGHGRHPVARGIGLAAVGPEHGAEVGGEKRQDNAAGRVAIAPDVKKPDQGEQQVRGVWQKAMAHVEQVDHDAVGHGRERHGKGRVAAADGRAEERGVIEEKEPEHESGDKAHGALARQGQARAQGEKDDGAGGRRLERELHVDKGQQAQAEDGGHGVPRLAASVRNEKEQHQGVDGKKQDLGEKKAQVEQHRAGEGHGGHGGEGRLAGEAAHQGRIQHAKPCRAHGEGQPARAVKPREKKRRGAEDRVDHGMDEPPGVAGRAFGQGREHIGCGEHLAPQRVRGVEALAVEEPQAVGDVADLVAGEGEVAEQQGVHGPQRADEAAQGQGGRCAGVWVLCHGRSGLCRSRRVASRRERGRRHAGARWPRAAGLVNAMGGREGAGKMP